MKYLLMCTLLLMVGCQHTKAKPITEEPVNCNLTDAEINKCADELAQNIKNRIELKENQK